MKKVKRLRNDILFLMVYIITSLIMFIANAYFTTALALPILVGITAIIINMTVSYRLAGKKFRITKNLF